MCDSCGCTAPEPKEQAEAVTPEYRSFRLGGESLDRGFSPLLVYGRSPDETVQLPNASTASRRWGRLGFLMKKTSTAPTRLITEMMKNTIR